MKYMLVVFTFLLMTEVGYARADTLREVHQKNHYFNISDTGNKKLIIYLHGGVSNPYFKNNPNVSLSNLLEGNAVFINKALENKCDVILPITNDSLNWISHIGFCFSAFQDYIETLEKEYSEVYISGFSDGGTGSFKLFYTYPSYFKGVIVFNGYPYNSNFASKANYQIGNHKRVLFFGTKKDKLIRYEFLMAAYCEQKKANPNTFLYLTKGKHSFRAYKKEDFDLMFNMLSVIENKKKEPLHGLVINDQWREFYKFRKAMVRKYDFGLSYYIENKKQRKQFKNR